MENAPNLSWVIWLAVSILVAVIIMMFTVVFPRFNKIQKLVDKLNLVARENLTGLRVVRAFHKEAHEESKFETVNTDLTRLNLFVNRVMVLMQPLMTLVMNFAMLAIVWYGAKLIDSGDINIGNMMAFMQYGIQVIMSFLMMSMIFIMVPRAAVSARRVSKVLATEPSIHDTKKSKSLGKNPRGIIRFDNVSFAYGDAEPVLKNISFTAMPGETTAIIGGTGSGKTTLVSMIPRLFDVSDGAVTFDDIDVRDIEQKELRENIGFVPQKANLFSGTIKSNIVYGNKKASRKLIMQAIKVSQSKAFIDKLPKGINSRIAQGGSNVSGGQKQRLAIARALAIEPKVYVFDDSFSALDLKTDRALRKDLAPITKNSTVIVVAQRIGTILNADKIVVLDEGKAVGIGKHNELMKKCRVYREIAESQLSSEELAELVLDEEAKNE